MTDIDQPCTKCKALVPVPEELFECCDNLTVICDQCFNIEDVVATNQQTLDHSKAVVTYDDLIEDQDRAVAELLEQGGL